VHPSIFPFNIITPTLKIISRETSSAGTLNTRGWRKCEYYPKTLFILETMGLGTIENNDQNGKNHGINSQVQ